MINFHIGAPRIGAELLQIVTAASTLKMFPDLLILPHASYRDTFRTLVNTKNSSRSKENDWQDARRLIKSLTYYDIVAISQHALLGKPQDMIVSPRGLARAVARTAALSALFEGHSLTFHFMITSQVEYITAALGSGARKAIAAGLTISWFDLVAQIKAAAPGRPFVVWDFERPQEIALPFLAEMLGRNEDAFIEEARQLIKQSRAYQGPINAHPDPHGIEDLLARLDDQYDIDLHSISGIEGLSLFTSSSLPGHLRL